MSRTMGEAIKTSGAAVATLNFMEAIQATGMAVLADDRIGCFVTWNGSATFNLWCGTGPDGYVNTDVKTVYGIADHDAAREVAQEWLTDIQEEAAANPQLNP